MTTTVSTKRARSSDRLEVVVVLAAFLAIGPLLWAMSRAPILAFGGLVGGALWVAVALRPVVGAYVLLGVTPLIVGVDRGNLVPVLRPNEALLVVVGSALGARWFLSLRDTRLRLPRPNAFELSMVAVAIFGSIVPLLWEVARGIRPSEDDVLYALTLWKYVGLFVVFRVAVTTRAQVRNLLFVSLAVGAVVVTAAILQARGVGPVAQFLARYYAPLGNERITDAGRGTSTIANSIALGDFAVLNFAVALALVQVRAANRLLLGAAALLFAVGAVGSGQFSGIVALIVGIVVVGLSTRTLSRLYLACIPAGLVAAVVSGPVVMRRLVGFESPEGMPTSWSGRLQNLRRFFWPRLFEGYHWVLGVRPAGRVAAPASDTWRDWVFIESGHTWLLWVGGVPLLVAFFVFLVVGARQFWRIARDRRDEIGAAAVAALTAICVIGVLTTFDAHLTMRGAADLAFPLFALALVGHRHRRRSEGTSEERGRT